MRITGLHIQAFGQLRDLTLGGLDANIVCFSGPNEIGKTTVFDFIGSMLYGIYPVTIENHPYAPRDAGVISGALSYRLDDGSSGQIKRRLRSSPEGEWMKGDGLFAHPQQIRNRTLPVVDHVTETVFRDVYALSLLDLKRFETSTFREIEERLLGGLNTTHIRPARGVADELHLLASKTWRQDNRGKPRARALLTRKRELVDDLRRARRTADELRDVSAQLELIDAELASLVPERESLRQAIADASAARTAADRSRSIETLRVAAEKVLSFDDVPDDPVALLEQFRADITSADDRIELVKADIRNVERASERPWSVRRVYQYRAGIRAACQELALVSSEFDTTEAWRRELPQRIAQFDASVRDISNVHGEPGDRLSHFAHLDREAIADEVRRGQSLNKELHRLDFVGAELASRNRFVGQATVLMTTTAILVWAFGPGWLAVLSAVLATATLAIVGHGLFRKRQIHRRRQLVRDEADQRLRRLAMLAGVLPTAVATGGGDVLDEVDVVKLGAELDRLAVEARELQRLGEEARLLQDRRGEAVAALVQLAQGTETILDGDITSDPERIAAILLTRASESESIVLGESDRDIQLAELREERERLEARRSSTEARARALTSRIEQLGDGEFRAGIAALAAGRTSRDELVRLADVDAAQVAVATAASVEGADAGDGAGCYDESALRRQEADVEARLEELSQRRSELQVFQLELFKLRTIDDVEGELESVENELRAARMRHDMLRFMESVVRRADERFREKHQPDVIARANEMLSLITDGKYRRLALDEKTLEVQIVQADDRTPRPIDESVSQGTRDQVYLALRLALAEHMDEAHEAIPIFLDEVFVTWDQQRRKRFYKVLSELSKRRQIFLLTCHGWFEEEAMVELGAHIVPLDRITDSGPALQMRAL